MPLKIILWETEEGWTWEVRHAVTNRRVGRADDGEVRRYDRAVSACAAANRWIIQCASPTGQRLTQLG